MNSSTNIMDLPTDPVNGGSIAGNVNFSINEKQNSAQETSINSTNSGSSNVTLDQSTINQIVNGLQQASSSGATQLISRDIPRNIENIINDPQVRHEYIPPAANNDYITEYEDNEDIIKGYNKNAKSNDRLDDLYNELQIPILLAILYFLFQLPIFKKYLYRFVPVIFSSDGNVNLYGYFFTCILFGLFYYIITKTTGIFNKF